MRVLSKTGSCASCLAERPPFLSHAPALFMSQSICRQPFRTVLAADDAALLLTAAPELHAFPPPTSEPSCRLPWRDHFAILFACFRCSLFLSSFLTRSHFGHTLCGSSHGVCSALIPIPVLLLLLLLEVQTDGEALATSRRC